MCCRSSRRTARCRCRRTSSARPTRADRERYQTIYAREPGRRGRADRRACISTPPLFAALEQRGVRTRFVTLHVGAGTFQPLRDDDIEAHVMHAE